MSNELNKTPYERLTDVQKAYYDGYDKGYEEGLKYKQPLTIIGKKRNGNQNK